MFKKIFCFWLPVIFWMFLIFWLSSFHKLQASPVNWQDFILRKLAHCSEYLILFLFYYRALKNTTKLSLKKLIITSLVLIFLYSLSDEFHQTFVGGRTGRIFDIGVDSSGGVLGAILINKFLPKASSKTKFLFKKLDLL